MNGDRSVGCPVILCRPRVNYWSLTGVAPDGPVTLSIVSMGFLCQRSPYFQDRCDKVHVVPWLGLTQPLFLCPPWCPLGLPAQRAAGGGRLRSFPGTNPFPLQSRPSPGGQSWSHHPCQPRAARFLIVACVGLSPVRVSCGDSNWCVRAVIRNTFTWGK